MLVLEMVVVVVLLGDGVVPLLEEVEKCGVASLLEVKGYEVVAEESRGSNHSSEQKPFQFKKTNGNGDVKAEVENMACVDSYL